MVIIATMFILNDLRNIYSMQDELTDDAMIYIYNSKTDKPILKNLNDETY